MATYELKIDETDGSIFYAGQAIPGSLPSSPVWQIQKITLGASSVDIVFADSNNNFDNIWDDRLSLSYP